MGLVIFVVVGLVYIVVARRVLEAQSIVSPRVAMAAAVGLGIVLAILVAAFAFPALDSVHSTVTVH